MIISLRGASGSGKTHLIRQVMNYYDVKQEIIAPRRRYPIGYELDSTVIPVRPLFIPGHYGSNAGIDSIENIETVYNLLWTHYELGHNALYEGKDGVSR